MGNNSNIDNGLTEEEQDFMGMIIECEMQEPEAFNNVKAFADIALSRATLFTALVDLAKNRQSIPVELPVSGDFGDIKKTPNVKVKIKGDAGEYWLFGVDWMHHKYLVDRGCGLEWVDWYKCKTKSQNSR